MKQKIKVKVTPNAKSNKVLGWQDDVLKVKVQAPAQNGLANAGLIEFLAKEWKLPKRAIKIVKGETARDKVLEIEGNVPVLKQTELPFDS